MNKEVKTTPRDGLRYGLLSVVLLFCVTVQCSAGGGLTLFGIPALPAVAFVIGVGMNQSATVGGMMGLLAGLLLDVYTVPSVGFHTLLMPILGIGCSLAVNHLLLQNRYARLVLCLAASFLYTLLHFVVIKWILGGNQFAYFYQFSLPMAGMCALLAFLFSLLLRRLLR